MINLKDKKKNYEKYQFYVSKRKKGIFYKITSDVIDVIDLSGFHGHGQFLSVVTEKFLIWTTRDTRTEPFLEHFGLRTV